jgi:soluble lytic murein transglycosylase-like protein
MSDFYLPKAQAVNPVQPPAQDVNQTFTNTSQTVQQAQNIDAAKAFQDHLNKGYQGMLEVLKDVPPNIASTLPDPGAFSDSEDKRVAWYGMVNDAVAKNGLLDQAQNQNANPDALATAAARAPLSPESQKLVSGEIGRLDQNQQKSAIQKAAGMFSEPPAAAAPKMETPPIDTKSNFGRTLKIAMTNMEPHADTIQNAATKAGIPPQLIMAVATQESGGSSGATSKTGVKGTMQVTDGTFKDVANRHPDLNLTDRTDPAQSYMAGGTYLGELVQKFGGNIDQALAAYNGGPTAVKAAVAKYPSDWKDHLDEFMTPDKASEASDYVDRVGKYYKALGGQSLQASAAPAKRAPTQDEFNQALLKENPDAVVNPIAKEIKGGLKTDAYTAANAERAKATTDAAAARIQQANERLKNTMSFQDYQKVNNYNKQVADLTAPVQSIARIGELLGGFNATGDVPGVGLGANLFKKFLMTSATPEARQMRLAVSNMFTDIGFSEAGKNFTNKEMDLVNQKLGLGDWQDADTFRKAMKIQAQKFQQRLSNPWNALPDAAKNEMLDAGVTNPSMLDVDPGPGASPAAGTRVAAAGKPKLSQAAQAAFDKIKAQRAARGN